MAPNYKALLDKILVEYKGLFTNEAKEDPFAVRDLLEVIEEVATLADPTWDRPFECDYCGEYGHSGDEDVCLQEMEAEKRASVS